ncbi:glycosyltransferase [Flavicella sp.]|uniref:glycosyltransferase n=1 Tax=Flavicella sp. TaxID=2957742 RepID=UPI0030162130
MKKKKICIVVSTLGLGGAEKVAALQSKIFTDLGHTVSVLSISKFDKKPFDFDGEIFVLEEIGFGELLPVRIVKRLSFLKKYLQENKIDLIVDNRSRKNFFRELLLVSFFYKVNTFYMIHSLAMIQDSNFVLPIVRSKFIFNKLYKKSSLLVCVSKGITSKIKILHNFDNLTTVYNSYDLGIDTVLLESQKYGNYILFYGRLDDESKDLNFLIEAYQKSILPEKNIKLVLLGDGPHEKMYKSLVSKLNLENLIIFHKRCANPFSFVRAAKFTVLTSHYEGFPMSIVESLACETPVVTVDCETGPSEIIKDRFNGLLVEKNLVSFTEALNSMCLDKKLLDYCKQNCLESIKHLSYDEIKKTWADLLS